MTFNEACNSATVGDTITNTVMPELIFKIKSTLKDGVTLECNDTSIIAYSKLIVDNALLDTWTVKSNDKGQTKRDRD